MKLGPFVRVVVLVVSAASPFAGCGTGPAPSSASASTGAGGGPTGAACASFCQGWLPCVNTALSDCVLADPAGAPGACQAVCQSGFAMLTPAQTSLLVPCMDCIGLHFAGQCFQQHNVMTVCGAACSGSDVGNAADAWGKGASNAALPAAGLCTNGMGLLGGTCFGGPSLNPCTLTCCNTYDVCSNPVAAASCTTPASGPTMCTCTAGKNKGKVFSSAGQCGETADGGAADIWSECNL
jgi:hypothetical protein